MSMNTNLRRSAVSMLLLLAMASPLRAEQVAVAPEPSAEASLNVYKSPTCGCCGDWIAHAEQNGFSTRAFHPPQLTRMKLELGIQQRFHSCHTAVSGSGYLFEGHVPARLVKQFLSDPPEGALGLSAPGMPMGSPGMEMGDRFQPYQVLLLKKDGGYEVYATIEEPSQQY